MSQIIELCLILSNSLSHSLNRSYHSISGHILQELKNDGDYIAAFQQVVMPVTYQVCFSAFATFDILLVVFSSFPNSDILSDPIFS